jgi:hypothetical protein
MKFAAVTYVNLEGRDTEEALSLLNERLVPMVKGLGGFRNALFLRAVDGKTGVGAVAFDTQANAEAGLDAMLNNRPSEAPPVVSSGVFQVVVEV